MGKRIRGLILLTVFATTILGIQWASAWAQEDSQLPAEDANMAALAQTAEASVATLINLTFCDEQSELSYSGQMNQQSWSVDLKGTYAAQPLSLSYKGTFDPRTNVGQFTGSGSFGPELWDASGTVGFSQSRKIMLYEGSTRIGVGAPWRWTATWLFSPLTPRTIKTDSLGVVSQEAALRSIIVVEIASWEFTRRDSTWLHTRTVIVIVEARALAPVPETETVYCRIEAIEQGGSDPRGVLQVQGRITIDAL